MSFRKVASTSLCAALMSLLAPAMAAPVHYTFSTGSIIYGPSEITSLLSGLTVSGAFTYEPATPLFGQSGDLGFEPGYSIYATSGPVIQSFYHISGAIGTHQFSDITGTTSVRNGYTGGVATSSTLDIITLNSEVTPKVGTNTQPTEYQRQLNGFTIGDYTLNNVRLLWVGGVTGGTFNFLNDSGLPAELPSFQGRLIFDFVRTDDPTNTANVSYYSNSVGFGGLTVQAAAVPEANTSLMMVVGLGILGLATRRRQHKRQVA
ncbi:PEP-CTERM sorting domain-containing protein [Aquabacterium sp.]|uniref:PEP-CTERM sorting domain-containing protein n=1 Tax=Aquabacterium sp. TaxID=1872578 RepID=UPI00248A6AFA|nr:PEP-CTERM sorting domain-containing protein [Aquabacterium sp.]MDI1259161.1 PEP-CTERM sorting domain-containing protein [Aquabacterium sp.]